MLYIKPLYLSFNDDNLGNNSNSRMQKKQQFRNPRYFLKNKNGALEV